MRLVRHRPDAATAMTEAAILAPLYMVMLYGLLFLGYSTLARQKEQAAAVFAAMQPGRQDAGEMMELFFPWNPTPPDRVAPLSDGSEAAAGDATLRVHEPDWVDIYNPAWNRIPAVPPSLGDTFDGRRIVEYLWVMSLGQAVQSPIRLGIEGDVSGGEPVQVLDYRASYLRSQGIVDSPPDLGDPNPPLPSLNRYSAGAIYGLNCAHDQPWADRREARTEYLYEPPFLPKVIGEPQDETQYMTLEYPEGDFTPEYPQGTRLVARGPGRRPNTVQVGDHRPLLRYMSVLLQDGAAMPDYLHDAELDALRDALWPGDTDPLWVAK